MRVVKPRRDIVRPLRAMANVCHGQGENCCTIRTGLAVRVARSRREVKACHGQGENCCMILKVLADCMLRHKNLSYIVYGTLVPTVRVYMFNHA